MTRCIARQANFFSNPNSNGKDKAISYNSFTPFLGDFTFVCSKFLLVLLVQFFLSQKNKLEYEEVCFCWPNRQKKRPEAKPLCKS